MHHVNLIQIIDDQMDHSKVGGGGGHMSTYSVGGDGGGGGHTHHSEWWWQPHFKWEKKANVFEMQSIQDRIE